VQVRSFKESDRESVIGLWQECGLVRPQNDPSKGIDRKLKVNPELFLVGEVGDDLIATVMGGYEGRRGWINYLGVKPSERRKGYGLQIVRAVEEMLDAIGCAKINLQIRTSNEAVIEFYRSIGYGVDDVVSMGKRLDFD